MMKRALEFVPMPILKAPLALSRDKTQLKKHWSMNVRPSSWALLMKREYHQIEHLDYSQISFLSLKIRLPLLDVSDSKPKIWLGKSDLTSCGDRFQTCLS